MTLLEYRNKIINAFKYGTFLSEYLKKKQIMLNINVLKNVDNFAQEIESMSKKIDLSLFKDFFESSSPADYVKMLINTSPNENKKVVAEIKDRISDLKDKNADETLNIIKKILDYNKDAQKHFEFASKVDKGKSKPKSEESIAERMKLRRQKLDIIAKINK